MTTRKTIAALLVALLMVPAAMAQTWEINAPTTVSADVTADYTDIVAHEVLTFQRGAVFKPETGASTTNYIGTAAGDAAGLVFSNTGSGSSPNIVIPSATHNVFSGGLANPAVLLSGAMQDKIYLYTIDVSADAVTSGDEIPFATLSYSGSSGPHAQVLNCNNFWNYNTKPAVIAFDGGSYRMVYKSATGFHVPAAANKIILRGVNGNDIVLAGSDNATYRFPYSDDAGTIATDGECDLRFDARLASKTFWVLFNKAFDDGQLDWGHTGETRFKNAKAQLCADNALPYSATVDRTNRVELISGAASGSAFLDLNGHSAKSGSLFVGTGAYVTNSADTAASLVFGEDNLDATFSGEIRGDVTLVKKGTGTLTIADGSVIPKIKLDGADLSTIVIDGAATVGAWDISFEPKAEGETTYAIASGETRDVAPFGLEPDWFWDSSWTNDYVGVNTTVPLRKLIGETGLSNGLHRVTVAAGGTALVDVASGETEKYEYMALAGAGTLRKTGAGAATILGDNRVSLGKLHVAEGTLAFQGRGCTNEWWRIVVTEGFDEYCYIGKVGFFDEYGVWTSAGTGYAGYNQAASDLAQGKYTFVRRDDSKEPSNPSNYDYSRLFTANSTMGMGFSLNSTTDRVTITFRMPSGEKPAVWHSLASASTGTKNPKKWTIETSADGVNWTVANNIADSQQYTHKNYRWRNDQRYRENEGLPWRIGIDNAPASVAALGTVQVDDGATLDLSATMNATVSAVEIDTAAIGGTIRGGALAASGTVNVVSDRGFPGSGEAVLTLDGVADAANIDSWPVSLNGVVDEKYKATFDSTTGNVTIAREKQGMIILVR